ncbi:hypothetical protein [Pseudoalteromonas sp.]|uniref:hypothetical protein n=1 Tax=Pseudoalteromonas sp. TaxID=53249 RepID=UPI003561B8D4
MTNKITQEYIDYLVDKTEKMEKRFNQLLVENAELRQANMLLRQQLDQKDERVFVANSCRSRNNHVDGYKHYQELMEDKGDE